MKKLYDVEIIELQTTESSEFVEILWTALNPEGVVDRNRSLLIDPIIKSYYENWGQEDDIGYAAIVKGKMVGAIWSRIKSCVTKEYATYPEIGIGVLADYQNLGIGTRLLEKLIMKCRGKYPGLRLGVNGKAIRVLSFYGKFGFTEYDKYDGSPQLQLTF